MFRVKICGITRPEDAVAAVECGADAIGINFYERSPRYVEPKLAQEIIAVAADAQVVGVFVNAPADKLLSMSAELGLAALQLHGDEPPALVAELAGHTVVRARRLDERGTEAIADDLAACAAAGHLPDAVLVDAHSPGQYGGTGETVAWSRLADHQRWLEECPLILAGGLTPENVAEAIRVVRPWGVDVASGVENSPGVKDHARLRLFIEIAQKALGGLD